MKKFSENTNEKTSHYAADQKLYNEIYDMIEESLVAKMDGEVSEKVSLIGKEDLVAELSKLVENEITKTKIKILESYKKQPTMIQEKVENEDPFLSLVNESRNQEKTYSNPLVQYIKESAIKDFYHDEIEHGMRGNDFESLDVLMQGREDDVLKAREIWENMSEEEKQNHYEEWVDANDPDYYEGRRITLEDAKEQIDYLLYKQFINESKTEKCEKCGCNPCECDKEEAKCEKCGKCPCECKKDNK